MKNKFGQCHPLPGRGSLGPPPVARPVPVPMRLGRAQPENTTWVPLPTGSPPVGGAKGVGCNVSWLAAEGEDLGGLILGD